MAEDHPIKATGPIVKIATLVDASQEMNSPQDDLVAGCRAAVRTINETQNGLGGSGQPIELEVFETNLNPARTAELARMIADDPAYVAVAGNLVVSYEVAPIFEEAGLAVVPGVPCTKSEYYSPVVFNVNGGHLSMDGGKIAIAFDCGAKRPGSLTTAIPGIPWFADVHNLTLKHIGLPEETKLIAAPYVVDDISPWVQEAVDEYDAVMLTLVNNQDTINAIIARNKLGITTPFIVEGMSLTPEFLKSVGDAGDGILVASLFPPDDAKVPGHERYLASMREADYENFVGDKAEMAWITFDLLNYATRGMKAFTRESILAALRKVTDYTGGGITPPLDFSKPQGPGIGYPRLYNWTYYPAKIENGKVVSDGPPGIWKHLPTDIPESQAAWEEFPAFGG